MARAQNVVVKTWKRIPPLIRAGIIGVGAFIVYKKVRREVDAIRARQIAKKNALILQNEQEGFIQGGEALSYPLSQYSAFANTLQVAMEGPWYDPTDENAVIRVLDSLNNNTDFLQLERSFGRRDGWDLNRWIQGDFTILEIVDLNKILESKGILYSF